MERERAERVHTAAVEVRKGKLKQSKMGTESRALDRWG